MFKLIKNFKFLLIFIIFFIILYISFLLNIINNKFYKNIKNFNCEIYSELITLKKSDNFNINKLIKILILSKYRLVKKVVKPGDFYINNKDIYLFRRSFFINKKFINKSYIKLSFNNNKILYILDINNNKFINKLLIDPQIIYFSNYKNKYRLYKHINEFPKTLINILILTEDKNFYNHIGIDIFSIIRALVKNIKNKRIVQGGSTITQQLSKNLFFSYKKSFIRKINEIFISLILELKHSKKKILEIYINEIFFGIIDGKEIYGFPMASICYFNTPISELDLNKQLILISMIKGPSLYNPYKNLNLLLKRKNFILKNIKNKNIIDELLYKHLKKSKINFNKNNFLININPNFINIIKKEINNKFDYNKCTKIFSTFSLITQNNLNISSKKIINKLRKSTNINDLEISMLVINYKKGEIKSAIGGFNNSYYGFNRIYIKRNIGSIIKPIIYLYALNFNKNYQLNSVLSNKFIYYKELKNKILKNENKYFPDKVLFIDSIVNSLNISTVNLGFNLGIDNTSKFIKLLIRDKNINVNNLPSIFLGSISLNLINVAQMYQSLANYGKSILLHSVKSFINNDNIQNNFFSSSSTKKLFSKKSSYLIMYCMKKVIEEGTAKNLIKNNLSIAGKTGTTNNFIDNWFVGIDNNEICIIWIGRDNNLSTKLYSSHGSMKVYEEYIKNNYIESIKLFKSKNIHYLNIDKFGNILCFRHKERKLPIITNDTKKLTKKCKNHTFIIRYLNKFINIY